jgi:perosamine synthetase
MNDTAVASMSFEPGASVPSGFIPLSVPEIGGNEWKYLKECLDTNWVSSAGPFVARFEEMVASFVGSRYAIATSTGTAALHVALLIAGVQPDDEVLLPTLTFIAPANAVRYVGAWPVFVDVDAQYWQMDTQLVADFLRTECTSKGGVLVNRQTGRVVRAILPVHILGHPVDMGPLLALAQEFGLAVVEDATESLGAEYKGVRLGRDSQLACFSFNGNKLITTGGGGMIVTNDEQLAARARYLTTQAKDDPVEYVHKEIGYNYRLTNLQGAIGCAQVEQIEAFINAKRSIAAAYQEGLSAVAGITVMHEAQWARSAFWMYTILVEEEIYGSSSRGLMQKLATGGVQSRPLWQPLHRSPIYAEAQTLLTGTAEKINRRALSLPCSVGLPMPDLQQVINLVRS